MKIIISAFMCIVIIFVFVSCSKTDAHLLEDTARGDTRLILPSEDMAHEGTWLIWPHNYGAVYDYYKKPAQSVSYRDDIENVWVAVTKELYKGELVHIVAYNEEEKAHIAKLLENENVDMNQIDFFIYETDDVWARDTGPIFVLNNGEVTIANFTFNGWGKKQAHERDNALPQAIADAYNIPIIQIPELVLEGGAIECDGVGTLLAAKSSVAGKNRNPQKSLNEVEAVLSEYLGISNFIWIKGVSNEDETDAHIDGTARFVNDRQLLLCSEKEYPLLYEKDDDAADWNTLVNAKNAKGEPYEIVALPLTKETVKAFGEDQYFYGSYTNYYIGNEVVLVPQYNDANDKAALDVIAKCYPDKRIAGIDCANLIYYGGMIHCITQQQPIEPAL